MTKFCAISDLHGQLPNLDPETFDVLLIAGDIVPLNYQQYVSLSSKWVLNTFNPWCEKIGKKIILVGGNHDLFLSNYKLQTNIPNSDVFNKNVIYLQNFHYMSSEFNIYGTPLCHKFGSWAFMWDDEVQEEIFENVTDFPRDVPYIFLCHDAPYGVSDICFENIEQKHIGNPKLRELVDRIKPDWVIHGHLHSSNHEIEMLDNTKVVNVSLLNEKYKQVFEPFYFEA